MEKEYLTNGCCVTDNAFTAQAGLYPGDYVVKIDPASISIESKSVESIRLDQLLDDFKSLQNDLNDQESALFNKLLNALEHRIKFGHIKTTNQMVGVSSKIK